MKTEFQKFVKDANKEYLQLKEKATQYTRSIGDCVWCANEAVKAFEENRSKRIKEERGC